MSNELIELKRKISSLPAGERDMLLRDLERPSNDNLTWQQMAVYRALRLECPLMGASEEAAERFVREYGPRKFAEKVVFVTDYLSAAREIMRRPQVESLITLVFRCLAMDMRQRSIPVTGRIMLDQSSNIPYAVDQRYPGYAEASLLHCLA